MRRPALVVVLLALAGHVDRRRAPTQVVAVRLVDVFKPEAVQAAVKVEPAGKPRALWRFGGDLPDVAEKLRPTFGWQAGPGVAGLAVREERLVGRSTTPFPIVYLSRPAAADADLLHAVEVRLKVWPGPACSFPTPTTRSRTCPRRSGTRGTIPRAAARRS